VAQKNLVVFLDTSALYALHDATDAHHSAAKRILARLTEEGALLHTHEWVALETLQLVRKRLGPALSVRASRLFLGNPALTLHFVDSSWWREILNRYSAKPALGLTDLASFSLMERLDITRAFAFDADFEAAGFQLEKAD